MKAEAVAGHCLLILTAETITIRKCGINCEPDSWSLCFTVGVKRHLKGS